MQTRADQTRTSSGIGIFGLYGPVRLVAQRRRAVVYLPMNLHLRIYPRHRCCDAALLSGRGSHPIGGVKISKQRESQLDILLSTLLRT